MLGLTPGDIYRFYTTAVNAIGDSDESKEVMFAAASLASKPAAIRRNAESGRESLIIEWDVESDNELQVTGYIVEADLTQCGEFTVIWDGEDRPEINKLTVPNTVSAYPYVFRHRAYNFNGLSEYSDEVTLFACHDPTPPSQPRWVTSTQTSITIEWDQSADDGGCPVIDYRVYRDSGNGLGEADIINEVHVDLLEDKTYITTLEVTDLPANSLGKSFQFIVKVFTKNAMQGVSSLVSDDIILAGVPESPGQVPTRRDSQSSEFVIAVDLAQVTGTNGAELTSYHVEIDDGEGGAYTSIKGDLADDLDLIAIKDTGIESGRMYRVRYRVRNIIGFSDYSDPGYILAASIPYSPEQVKVEFVANEVKIQWSLPYNAGSFITQAEVEILGVDGVTYQAHSDCDV